MDKTTVRGIFEYDQSIMDRLSKAKRLTLDFEDDDDDSIEMQISARRRGARRAEISARRTGNKVPRASGAVD